MSVKIIIDSTTDLAKDIQDKVITVPITIRFGNTEYTDGVDITNRMFYEKLIESDILPTTSQATPLAFEETFKKIKENGDTAVVITISSKLSGTFQSATIASEEYKDCIYIVDSASVAIGAGILTEHAIKLAEECKSAKEIYDELMNIRENVYIVALLDTLEYL